MPVADELDLDRLLQAGFRYAVTLCRDRTEAHDLVQEACLGIVRAGGDFTKPYLFAAIRNRTIDRYRRRHLRVVDPLPEEGVVDPAEDLPELLADRDALERAFAGLRETEREALYLNVVEGYSAREIGELTETPRNTVLSLLARGRKKLHKLLTESGDFEEVAS